MKPDINLVEVDPQLSHNKHPVDGALVGSWPLFFSCSSFLLLFLALPRCTSVWDFGAKLFWFELGNNLCMTIEDLILLFRLQFLKPNFIFRSNYQRIYRRFNHIPWFCLNPTWNAKPLCNEPLVFVRICFKVCTLYKFNDSSGSRLYLPKVGRFEVYRRVNSLTSAWQFYHWNCVWLIDYLNPMRFWQRLLVIPSSTMICQEDIF